MKNTTIGDIEKQFPQLTLLTKAIIELNRDFYGQQENFERMSLSHLKMILENRGLKDSFRKCSLSESRKNLFLAKTARNLWRGSVKQLGKVHCDWILQSALKKALESSKIPTLA